MSSSGKAADRPTVVLVAAVARNGVIGDGRDLVWRLPEDLTHFREVTTGCTVVMGRRTWESLPPKVRPLPGRRNIVMTRQPGWSAPGAEVAQSLEAALALAAEGDAKRVCVIGGAEVYAAALPMADELELTELQRDFAGVTVFPDWPREHFREVSRRRLRPAPPNDFDIDFVTYRRVA